MGFLKGALKTTVAMKVIEIVRREASKPQNQAKAKSMFSKTKRR